MRDGSRLGGCSRAPELRRGARPLAVDIGAIDRPLRTAGVFEKPSTPALLASRGGRGASLCRFDLRPKALVSASVKFFPVSCTEKRSTTSGLMNRPSCSRRLGGVGELGFWFGALLEESPVGLPTWLGPGSAKGLSVVVSQGGASLADALPAGIVELRPCDSSVLALRSLFQSSGLAKDFGRYDGDTPDQLGEPGLRPRSATVPSALRSVGRRHMAHGAFIGRNYVRVAVSIDSGARKAGLESCASQQMPVGRSSTQRPKSDAEICPRTRW